MKNHIAVCLLATLGMNTVAADASTALATALKDSYAAEKEVNYEKAIRPLEALAPTSGGAYLIQLRLGWLHYCNAKYDTSIIHYQKAVQFAPNAVEPLLGLMMVQTAAGKADDALHTGLLVMVRDPNNYTALSRLAWLNYQAKEYRKSISCYRKLVELYPTDTEMLIGLGYALKKSGEAKEADACFQKVLLLSPDNARALESLKRSVAAATVTPPMNGR